MKVSGSIRAANSNYLEYAKLLRYANVDYLHIDIFQDDEIFDLKNILKFDNTFLPLDVHMIYSKITKQDIDILNKANVKYLNVQFEALGDKNSIVEISKLFKGNFGIAITSETQLEVVEKYIKHISQVLIMCSQPGVSGAQFDELNFERINKLHDQFPSLDLFADGGINNLIGEKMGKLGVSLVVSGSYLSNNMEQIEYNAYSLKYLNEHNVSVVRNMMKINSLPIIKGDASFIEVINVMNQYRMGIVFIVVEDVLKGIITDGDVRRGFLKYKENIFQKKASELMNTDPLVIDSSKSMEDVFQILAKIHKGIDVVPIVENTILLGALDLHIGI